MTDLRTAAQQALEALRYHVEMTWPIDRTSEAIFNLRAALAQPQIDPVDEYRKGFIAGQIDMRDREQPAPEPVAWRFQSAVGGWAYGSEPPIGSKYPAYPLYAAPPQRKPLTEEEIERICEEYQSPRQLARAVERAYLRQPEGGGNLPPPLRAEPAQEPVAWASRDQVEFLQRKTAGVSAWLEPTRSEPFVVPLHVCPPQRRLTDDEIGQLWFRAKIPGLTETSAMVLIRAAEEMLAAGATEGSPSFG